MRLQHRALLLFLLLPPAALALGAAAVACLPDLEVVHVAADAGTDAPPDAASPCGDGRIDPDAGEECDPGTGAAVGCLTCKLQCDDDGGIDPASGHCYFVSGMAGFTEADQTKCGAAGAHVVSFVSEDELAFVTAKVSKTSPFWVDLVRKDAGYVPSVSFEPGFAFGCPGCYAHVDAGVTAFPLRAGTPAGACVIGQDPSSGPWLQSPCAGNKTWEVICEREPPGSRAFACGGAVCISVPRTFPAKRYVYVPAPAAANDASAACAQMHGALVMFDSPEEREQLAREISIQDVASTGPSTEIWIGLSRQSAAPWLWDDGKVRPQPWGLADGGAEPANAPVSGRAFLRIQTGSVDSELAHPGNAAADAPDRRPFVCQL